MWTRLLAWDVEFSRKLNVHQHPSWVRWLGTILAHSGDSWFWLAGLGLTYWLGGETWKWRALIYIFGILVTALLVMTIKFAVRRRRPEGEWGAIYRRTDPHSFPSGHAARAVLLAVLALGSGPPWWGVLLAVWAPFVVLARVAMGVHYFSDVLVGTFIGMIVGIGVLFLMPCSPVLF